MIEPTVAELADLLDQAGVRVHFVGVGGAGTAPLASIASARGWRVSGCDLVDSEALRALEAGGVTVAHGHDPRHVEGCELVVASAAVPADAPELVAARRSGIPSIKRAVLAGALTCRGRAICVAGTHGKTTTTAMVAVGLMGAGLDPSVLVGGSVPGIGVGGRAGNGDAIVVEADEFDRSFLHLRPRVAVITSVEADHLDYYGSLTAIEEAFRQFLDLVANDGVVVGCHDDEGARRLAPSGAVTYGIAGGDWRARALRKNDLGGTDFVLRWPGGETAVRLAVPGTHNVLNATAALAACHAVGVLPADAARPLATFAGASRRFEKKGVIGGIAVYDDYAHNPTKVRAALDGARARTTGRLWCIFQPHTYHRTASLFDRFARSFDEADVVLALPIYSPAGREEPIEGLTSARLVHAMGHRSARAVDTFDEAASITAAEARPGDLIVTVGAGDVTRLGPLLLERLAAR